MSSLIPVVLLLLVLVTLLLAGGIGWAVHRYPALSAPVTAAGAAVMLVVACLAIIGAR
ncbi:hypothetical protein ABT236_30530 [Streptomyces sp. NPDC001523]|uniref:hypothetical protein n=1 Tax=Streptomyces sp. NPDC001523 TaxID=3154383 RepID=UPI0033344B6E